MKFSSVFLHSWPCTPGYLLKHRLQLYENVVLVREMEIVVRQVAWHFWTEAFPLLLELSEPHENLLGIVLMDNGGVLMDVCLDKIYFFSHRVETAFQYLDTSERSPFQFFGKLIVPFSDLPDHILTNLKHTSKISFNFLCLSLNSTTNSSFFARTHSQSSSIFPFISYNYREFSESC